MKAADFKKYLVIASGCLALIYAVAIFVYVPTRAFPGFYVFNDRRVQYIGKEKSRKTGIERGDRIVRIAGRQIENMPDYIAAISRLKIDSKVDIQVLKKDGSLKDAPDVSVGHTPFPFDALLWCFVALPIFFFGYYIYFKRPWERSVRLFCLLCALTTVAFLGGLHWMVIIENALMFSFFIISGLMFLPVSLHFFLTFPRTKRFFMLRRYVRYLIYLPAVAVLIPLEFFILKAYVDYGAREYHGSAIVAIKVLFLIGLFLGVFYFIACVAGIVHSFVTAQSGEMKKQIKWILWGAGVAALPLLVSSVFAMADFSRFVVGNIRILAMVAFLTLLVSYAFSIIKYRLSDVDTFINRSISYFVLAAVAVAIYFIVLGFSTVFFDVELKANTIIPVLLSVLVIAFIIHPLLEKAQKIIDRRFYKEKYEYQQAITQVSEALVSNLKLDELLKTIGDTVVDALAVDHGAIFLHDRERQTFDLAYEKGDTPEAVKKLSLKLDHPLIRLISDLRSEIIVHPLSGPTAKEKSPGGGYLEELARMKAEMLIPFIYEEDILGFMMLGEKKSRDYYSSEDVRLLRTLANQASVAINNASSYNVIEALNRNLQEKIDKIEEQQKRILVLQERLVNENLYLKEEIRQAYNFDEIVGSSTQIKNVLRLVEKIARTGAAVLILGESGTGKELIARAIHFNSDRKDMPFIKVSCAALAEGVLESELFGHVRGAFTGAVKDKAGRFQLADKGTIFLDEIGDISLNTQLKLLRVLQEKEIEQVGGLKTIKVDVRVLAATNRDLETLVKQGKFREDLFYRLNVISIYVPPLRWRKDDIFPLTMHFLAKYSAKVGKNILRVDEETIDFLQEYQWPGNVRELENLIERAVVLADGDTLTVDDFPKEIKERGRSVGAPPAGNGSLSEALGDIEKEQLTKALKDAGGNKSRAAKSLGLKRSTFISKLKKYQLA